MKLAKTIIILAFMAIIVTTCVPYDPTAPTYSTKIIELYEMNCVFLKDIDGPALTCNWNEFSGGEEKIANKPKNLSEDNPCGDKEEYSELSVRDILVALAGVLIVVGYLILRLWLVNHENNTMRRM